MTEKSIYVDVDHLAPFPLLNADAQIDASEYLKELEGVPENIWDEYSLVYFGTWSTYEEGGSLLVLYKDGNYYMLQGGHSVMDDNNADETWADLQQVDRDIALHEAHEFQEVVDNTDDCLN